MSQTNQIGFTRWDIAPPDVEQLEAEWWNEFAWLEDEFAWVQPPEIRYRLRNHYLRQIIASIPSDGVIVDYGCGPGWLAIMLAELGAKHVIGVDNAPAQIKIAQRKSAEAGLTGKVDFFATMDPAALRDADAVVIHGVLHHLSWSEINSFTELLYKNIPPRCKVFMLEPVQGTKRYLPWSIPHHLLRRSARLRRQAPEEARIRNLLDHRGNGKRYPGYGVAPKEMPFRVGELEARLGQNFNVTRGRPVLFFSVQVAMELLLMAQTYPSLARFCIRFLLPPYMLWERLSFAFRPAALWNGWVFCLYEARPRRSP